MTEVRSKLAGIADIEPPLLPPESSTDIVMFAILAAVIVLYAVYLFWRYRYSLRGQARRRLSHLQQTHIPAVAGNRYATFQLATILRVGLNLQQVSPSTPLPPQLQQHQARWQSFVQQLCRARYAPVEVTDDILCHLLKDAGFWLRCWP